MQSLNHKYVAYWVRFLVTQWHNFLDGFKPLMIPDDGEQGRIGADCKEVETSPILGYHSDIRPQIELFCLLSTGRIFTTEDVQQEGASLSTPRK